MFAVHTSDKGLVFKIHKESQQSKKKRTDTLEENTTTNKQAVHKRIYLNDQ